MNREKIRLLATGWYYGIEPPSAKDAVEHFQACTRRDPMNGEAYGQALALFLKIRQVMTSAYVPAVEHDDPLLFRKRMAEYTADESFKKGGSE